MRDALRRPLDRAYEHLLGRELSETPTHVAVIQDGNRRYASKRGGDPQDGHEQGAETAENVLRWCDELDIDELTLYAFSTENFQRPAEEREHIFDLVERKFLEFADADRVHEAEVRVRAIGEIGRLPDRVREAIDYADRRTRGYDGRHLNIALAYGGRAELLTAAREIAEDVAAGDLAPEDVDVETVESALYDGPTRDVDLIVRTGGDERTSNFLPWQANGNEAAVFFCAPYWPEFRKIDFLRGLRTYDKRQESWRQSRAERSLALVRALGAAELDEARATVRRFRDRLGLPEDAPEDLRRDGADPEADLDPAAD